MPGQNRVPGVSWPTGPHGPERRHMLFGYEAVEGYRSGPVGAGRQQLGIPSAISGAVKSSFLLSRRDPEAEPPQPQFGDLCSHGLTRSPSAVARGISRGNGFLLTDVAPWSALGLQDRFNGGVGVAQVRARERRRKVYVRSDCAASITWSGGGANWALAKPSRFANLRRYSATAGMALTLDRGGRANWRAFRPSAEKIGVGRSSLSRLYNLLPRRAASLPFTPGKGL